MLLYDQLEGEWDNVEKNSSKGKKKKRKREKQTQTGLHRVKHQQSKVGLECERETREGVESDCVSRGQHRFDPSCPRALRLCGSAIPQSSFKDWLTSKQPPFWRRNWVCFYLQTSKFNFKTKIFFFYPTWKIFPPHVKKSLVFLKFPLCNFRSAVFGGEMFNIQKQSGSHVFFFF